MAQVLIIEDEPDVAALLEYNLRNAGHEPVIADCAAAGIRIARASKPDLILLDLLLPDRPGIDVCRELKSEGQTREIPIIIVTAKGEEIDRVVGFELGCDDYVTKPFSTRELLLRIKRSLERRGRSATPMLAASGQELHIDREAHRVFVGDQECVISALEFKLLIALSDYRDRVLTREKLLKVVWGLDTTVCLRTVDAHVKRLRSRLGPAGACVETVRGVGYRFSAALKFERQPTVPNSNGSAAFAAPKAESI
jgi:two-component system phosphate regulon response regulator PhoB